MAALAALNPNPKSELNYSTPFELRRQRTKA